MKHQYLLSELEVIDAIKKAVSEKVNISPEDLEVSILDNDNDPTNICGALVTVD